MLERECCLLLLLLLTVVCSVVRLTGADLDDNVPKTVCELGSDSMSVSRAFRLGTRLYLAFTPVNISVHKPSVSRFVVFNVQLGQLTQMVEMNEMFGLDLHLVNVISATLLQYNPAQCDQEVRQSPGCHLMPVLRNTILLVVSRGSTVDRIVLRHNQNGRFAVLEESPLQSLRFKKNQLIRSVTYDDELGRICFLVFESNHAILWSEQDNYPGWNLIMCKHIDPKTGNFNTSSKFEEFTVDLIDDVAIVDIGRHLYLVSSHFQVFKLKLAQKRAIIKKSHSLHSVLNCDRKSNSSFVFGSFPIDRTYVDILAHDRSFPVFEGTPTNYPMLVLVLFSISIFMIFFIALCFICKSDEVTPSETMFGTVEQAKQVSTSSSVNKENANWKQDDNIDLVKSAISAKHSSNIVAIDNSNNLN